MQIILDTSSVADYQTFLKVKSLPSYRVQGRCVWFPDEYAERIGRKATEYRAADYTPPTWMFDYQRDITAMAIRKRKFCLFIDCGFGKTGIFLEYSRHVRSILPSHKRILIVSPLMVIPQTLDECRKFFGDTLSIERVDAAHLHEWMHGEGGIGITNYDAIRDDLEQGNLGCLILDECFAPGTKIDVLFDNGVSIQKPIENILPGDTIMGAFGLSKAIAIKKREVSHAIAIKAGTKITCSPNHPFFTQRGWVCAQDLEPGDSILSTRAAVRMVQCGVSPKGYEGRSQVLQSILFSEMEDEPDAVCCEMPNSRSQSEAWGEEGRVVSVGISEGCERVSSHRRTESDEQSSSACQGIGNLKENEAQTFRAWWQRDGLDCSADDLVGCTGARLEGGISFAFGEASSGLSSKLQARFSERRNESVYRGGWSIPLLSKSERCQAGCESDFTWVESVEVLEQGHPELERLREADGKLYFYDIEAERHPSYSVNGLLVHNSSMLKSHYGKWGTKLLELGRGLDWKLAGTGTPAPNDRIEFANHAVFMDAFPNVNAFLARFFVNKGQTQERWILKPHALQPFYVALSHWSIFVTNPTTYGWHDNAETIPPIHIHEHDVPLTDEQKQIAFASSGSLFAHRIGGITNRSVLSQIAKGSYHGERIATNKPQYIRRLVESWPDESTIIWCRFNAEQEILAETIPEAASIDGSTPDAERQRLVYAFKAGRIKTLITKPKILGFGMNLQIATRQIFSACDDSYEDFYQAVKRSNRVGSTRPLNVHIPVTTIERIQMENVLRKARMVQSDAEEQERIFRNATAD